MAEQHRKPRPRPPSRAGGGPTPGSFKPGDPRINRNGRPRAGLAFAERGRERISPDAVLDLAMRVLEDETLPPRERLAIVMPVVDRCYQRPPLMSELDARVSSASSNLPSNWSEMTPEARMSWLEAARSGQPLASTGDASDDASTSTRSYDDDRNGGGES